MRVVNHSVINEDIVESSVISKVIPSWLDYCSNWITYLNCKQEFHHFSISSIRSNWSVFHCFEYVCSLRNVFVEKSFRFSSHHFIKLFTLSVEYEMVDFVSLGSSHSESSEPSVTMFSFYFSISSKFKLMFIAIVN